jgi:hypothetical protein
MSNNTKKKNGQFNTWQCHDKLLKFYEIQTSDFRMRHTAIWFEVKHYTWVLSFLLGAGPIAIATGKVSLTSHLWIFIILAALGLGIATIAYKIIKKDFEYYTWADSRLLFLEKKLGIIEEADFLDNRLSRAIIENFSVDRDIEKVNSFTSCRDKLSKIRYLIISTFLLYGVGAILLIIYYLNLLYCFL